MSLTNRQAALIAATNYIVEGDLADVYEIARGFESWLNRGDAPPEPVVPVRAPVLQCPIVSGGGVPCELDEGHDGGHKNHHDGISWGKVEHVIAKPQRIKDHLRHFTGGISTPTTACGLPIAPGLELTFRPRADVVTCEACRTALGL